MADASRTQTRSVNYSQARSLVLILGIVALSIVVLIMYVRRVDPTEVSATMFFLPVFIGFLFWGMRGGLILGVVATVGYIWLRSPAIDLVGWSEFTGLIITRGVGYVAFGLIGGWAADQLRDSITKLDLYDQIDNATGLGNSRSLVETVDLEKSRASRYEKIFSLVVADLPSPEEMGRRAKRNFLTDLGDRVERSVRNVDHAVHATDGASEVLAFVLPETSAEGARTFAAKLIEQITSLAAEHSAKINSSAVSTSAATFPDDPAGVGAITARFRAIAAVEFPEAPDSSA
jgi:GGDEF domain-containing protein